VKRQIVIFSGFNRAIFELAGETGGVPNCLTEDWISKRANIWKNFTWKSIQNQTCKKWVYCLCCHVKSKELIEKYFSDITDERFHIAYMGTKQEKRVMAKMASGMQQMVNVRIDSDDMYSPDAIRIYNDAIVRDRTQDWFMFRRGYAYQYEERNKRMKYYSPGHGSTPFFAKRYSVGEWLKQGEIAIKCQHHKVKKLHKPKMLPDGHVLVGIQGTNTTTKFKHPCFSKDYVKGNQKLQVLERFGIV
jgi:hypothetical protein